MQLIGVFCKLIVLYKLPVTFPFLKRDWGEKKALNNYQGIRYFKILRII